MVAIVFPPFKIEKDIKPILGFKRGIFSINLLLLTDFSVSKDRENFVVEHKEKRIPIEELFLFND